MPMSTLMIQTVNACDGYSAIWEMTIWDISCGNTQDLRWPTQRLKSIKYVYFAIDRIFAGNIECMSKSYSLFGAAGATYAPQPLSLNMWDSATPRCKARR